MSVFSSRRKATRLLVAGSLLAGMALVGVSGSASADILPIDNCNTKVPTGSVPRVPGIYDPADTCIKRMERTLVFVGQAILNNGVNFAGVGDPNITNSAGRKGGGNFDFDGICVMVDWQNGTGHSAPSASAPVPCVFGTTGGHYHGPTANGNFVGQTLGGRTGNNLDPRVPVLPDANSASGLNWNPGDQASCFNSSGGGTSAFTSKGAFGSETWTSSYTWTNSLNNFVGTISNGSLTGKFNAKIRTDADPAADRVKLGDRTSNFTYNLDVDRTDAGCLDKTINEKVPAYGAGAKSRLGLQALLVAGTATWDIQAPGLG